MPAISLKDRVVLPSDRFNLQRFVEAQAPVLEQVRFELEAGCKVSHWMWFVFPQIAGLGMSAMSRRYAIGSAEEALAYLAHPVLGARLREHTAMVNGLEGLTVYEIFGAPDDAKFHSSMTLFAEVHAQAPAFGRALERYFEGAPDPATLRLLRAGEVSP